MSTLEVKQARSKRRIRYLSQVPKDGAVCFLIALCNALLYFRKVPPRKNSKRWNELVRLGACDTGPCIHLTKLARALGLRIHRIKVESVGRRVMPAIVTIRHPKHGLHAVFVIEQGCNSRGIKDWVVANLDGAALALPLPPSRPIGAVRVPVDSLGRLYKACSVHLLSTVKV